MRGLYRITLVATVFSVMALGAGCAPTATDSAPTLATVVPTPTTDLPTTTAPPVSTTSSEPRSGFRFYKVDPGTLEPLPGFEPIHTGDTHGMASPNGRWLVLESWGKGRWLIDTHSFEVAADLRPWGSLTEVRDDGTFYSADWDPVLTIRRFPLGIGDWEEVVRLESEANLWSTPTFIDDHRLAARGFSEGIYVEGGEITVNVIDVSTGVWKQIPVPGAWVPGEPTGIVLDGFEVTTYHDPAVVFTEEKAFVVHGHEDVITEVDLNSGELARHSFAPKTSLVDSLLAWVVPPAAAKGPAPGVRRNAIVSRDGSKLYVSGYHTELVEVNDQIQEKTRPLGVQVIDIESWEVEKTLDLPIGLVHLSPDGSTLLATGAGESVVSDGQRYDGSGVYAITTDSYEVTHFDTRSYDWDTGIDFSADGSYAYLSRGFRIQVIDLERLAIVAETRSTRPLSIWGGAGVVSEWLGQP